MVWRCDASLFSSHYFADSELMVSASIGIVEVWQYGDGFSDGAPEVHLRALAQEKEKMKGWFFYVPRIINSCQIIL